MATNLPNLSIPHHRPYRCRIFMLFVTASLSCVTTGCVADLIPPSLRLGERTNTGRSAIACVCSCQYPCLHFYVFKWNWRRCEYQPSSGAPKRYSTSGSPQSLRCVQNAWLPRAGVRTGATKFAASAPGCFGLLSKHSWRGKVLQGIMNDATSIHGTFKVTLCYELTWDKVININLFPPHVKQS